MCNLDAAVDSAIAEMRAMEQTVCRKHVTDTRRLIPVMAERHPELLVEWLAIVCEHERQLREVIDAR